MSIDLTDDTIDLLKDDDQYNTFVQDLSKPNPTIFFKPKAKRKIIDEDLNWVCSEDEIWIDSYSRSESGSMDSSGSDFNDDIY